jgi:hypothetical protein
LAENGALLVTEKGKVGSGVDSERKMNGWLRSRKDLLLLCQSSHSTFIEFGSDNTCRAFADSNTLVICTLSGKIRQYHISREKVKSTLELEETRSIDTMEVVKVNAMIVNDNWITIGGLGKKGEGVIEAWNRNTSCVITR